MPLHRIYSVKGVLSPEDKKVIYQAYSKRLLSLKSVISLMRHESRRWARQVPVQVCYA